MLDRINRYETTNVRHRYRVEARLEQLQARQRENGKMNSEGTVILKIRRTRNFAKRSQTGAPATNRGGALEASNSRNKARRVVLLLSRSTTRKGTNETSRRNLRTEPPRAPVFKQMICAQVPGACTIEFARNAYHNGGCTRARGIHRDLVYKATKLLSFNRAGTLQVEQSLIFYSEWVGGLQRALLRGEDRAAARSHLADPSPEAGPKPGSAQGIAWDAQTFTSQVIHRFLAQFR